MLDEVESGVYRVRLKPSLYTFRIVFCGIMSYQAKTKQMCGSLSVYNFTTIEILISLSIDWLPYLDFWAWN